MNSIVKWFVVTAVIAGVVSGMVIAGNNIFDDPHNSQAWVKPGIAQTSVPVGVDTAVAFENVTIIPMDSERIMGYMWI